MQLRFCEEDIESGFNVFFLFDEKNAIIAQLAKVIESNNGDIENTSSATAALSVFIVFPMRTSQ